MSKLLKNVKNLENFMAAVDKCNDDVILRRCDGSEEFNLKSILSRYVALGKLCDEHGDEYEVFVTNPVDEGFFLEFFTELNA